MNENIVYKKVGVKDVEQYHEIRLECLRQFPQHFGTLYDEELKSLNFKFDKIIAQSAATDFLMGAFSNDRLIGICGFILEKREKTKHIGDISGMFVMPEFSGHKIGAGLLYATLIAAFYNASLEQIILAVADENKRAYNLYKKFGFVEYGRLPNYFKEKDIYETLVFMTLTREYYLLNSE
jgi:ribosomal protein S18 acetylase RimI-like enzyme